MEILGAGQPVRVAVSLLRLSGTAQFPVDDRQAGGRADERGEGDPPRLRIWWRMDALRSLREVIVMVDGEVCAADPVPPGAEVMRIYRVPDIGTITVAAPARWLVRAVPNVTVNGRLLAGTGVAPDILDRTALACGCVVAAELVALIPWRRVVALDLPGAALEGLAIHAAIGAATILLVRRGGWCAVLGAFAALLGVASCAAAAWSVSGAAWSRVLLLAGPVRVLLAFMIADLASTRRRAPGW